MSHFNRWFSVILGLIVGSLGLIPLLSKYGLIQISLRSFPIKFLSVLTAFGGFYLIIDGIMDWLKEDYKKLALISIIVGLIVGLMGSMPLLSMYGITLGFISTIFSYTYVAANYFYVLAGLLLIISGFAIKTY